MEFGEADELDMQSSKGISWSSIMGTDYDATMSVQFTSSQLQVDTHARNPSISQEKLYSIIDFSPKWAYSNLETKVLIRGTFLKSQQELSNCRWSIMFGEMEVTAEVLIDGILSCCAPLHEPGFIPFYVTCSNRMACSEIREFEYRLGADRDISSDDVNGDSASVMLLYQRFEVILCVEPVGNQINSAGNDIEKQIVIYEIISLMMEENDQKPQLTSENDQSHVKVIEQLLLEKQLKLKFYFWLIDMVTKDGKGVTTIDEGGQSVLHLAAALGFNFALQALVVSGVSIDFRDVNGWTALHWAAFYGREETVAALVSLGATTGALTDPSAEYPLGRTPADLASFTGHKGISGFLAETSLTSQLKNLRVNDGPTTEVSGVKVIQTVSEHLPVRTTEEDVPDTLKDSFAAVRNATQAAAHIHRIFRVQSFQRELLSDSWKKRKESGLIRERVVKSQAQLREHQVRKKENKIIWSVGILEKVILRWRRKGSGLRGFRSDAVQKGPNTEGSLPQLEDDCDFQKEGRKQTEERVQKALARVKSMVQYPQAQAQYRRMLTTAEGFRKNKAECCNTSATNLKEKEAANKSKGGRTKTRKRDFEDKQVHASDADMDSRQENASNKTKRGKGKAGNLNINLQGLEPYIGQKLKDVAEQLGVSRSTIKRICRKNGIQRWPSNENHKKNPSFFMGESAKESAQDSQQNMCPSFFSNLPPSDMPLHQNAPHANPESTQGLIVQPMVDMVVIKAKYEDNTIKFELCHSAGREKLMEEVSSRLNLEMGSFKLEYLDEDNDRILLACDNDLQMCLKNTAANKSRVQMFVKSK